MTKSGVLAFVEFIAYAGIPTPAWILLMLLASSFGICVLVTAEISNLVLGESMCIHSKDCGWGAVKFKLVGESWKANAKGSNFCRTAPSGLLIAAVVAAIPLGGECIGIYQCEFAICPAAGLRIITLHRLLSTNSESHV